MPISFVQANGLLRELCQNQEPLKFSDFRAKLPKTDQKFARVYWVLKLLDDGDEFCLPSWWHYFLINERMARLVKVQQSQILRALSLCHRRALGDYGMIWQSFYQDQAAKGQTFSAEQYLRHGIECQNDKVRAFVLDFQKALHSCQISGDSENTNSDKWARDEPRNLVPVAISTTKQSLKRHLSSVSTQTDPEYSEVAQHLPIEQTPALINSAQAPIVQASSTVEKLETGLEDYQMQHKRARASNGTEGSLANPADLITPQAKFLLGFQLRHMLAPSHDARVKPSAPVYMPLLASPRRSDVQSGYISHRADEQSPVTLGSTPQGKF